MRSETVGLRAVDLFAGAGGLGLGLRAAGVELAASIEYDGWACETLRENHQGAVVQADIREVDGTLLEESIGPVDLVVGGPPCQGFSVSNNSAGDPKDPRNSLFRDFLRVADALRPEVVLLENVPGLLRRRTETGEPVIDAIYEEMTSVGLKPQHFVLEAWSVGVPQLRPRLFVVGTRDSAESLKPAATHEKWVLNGSRAQQRLSQLQMDAQDLLPTTTLWGAVSDLPSLEAGEGDERGCYVSAPATELQTVLRAGGSDFANHRAMRHSKRMVERFSHLRWGQSGADAPEHLRARKRGNNAVMSGRDYDQNNRRLHPARPSHTLPASFYANFVHPFDHRNLTPREGARIQTFPDWYQFMGKPTVVSRKLLAREGRTDELHLCQYNQVGNAVPPLVGHALARSIIDRYLS